MSDVKWQEDALAAEGEESSLLTRNDLIRAAAVGGAALAAGGTLAERALGGLVQRPQRGGRLRVAHVGAGKSESFNPGRGSSFIDASRYYNLYDPLVRVRPGPDECPGPRARVDPEQGLDAVARAPASGCDLPQRQGPHRRRRHLHAALDGRREARGPRVGERDQARRAEEGRPPRGADPADVAQRPAVRQLQRPEQCRHPRRAEGLLEAGRHGPVLASGRSRPASGASASRTRTTGRTASRTSTSGRTSRSTTPSARLNALLAGEIDMHEPARPAAGASAPERDGEIQRPERSEHRRSRCSRWRSTSLPFDDPRVRQAFRLIPDRQALINGALAGFGDARQRPLRRGAAQVLRGDLPARARPGAGEVRCSSRPAQEDLEVTPADLGHRARLRRGRHALRRSRRRPRASTSTSRRSPATAYFDTSLLYTKIDFAQSFWTVGLARRVVSSRRCSRTPSGTRRTGATVVRQADPRGAGRPERRRGRGAVARGAADPVRRGRLHHLDEHQHRRRARQVRSAACGRARSSTSAAGTTGASGSTSERGPSRRPRSTRRPRRQRSAAGRAFAPRLLRVRPCARASGRAALADAVRRLDARLRRHRGAAGRRGQRRPRQVGDAGAARRAARADGARPPGRGSATSTGSAACSRATSATPRPGYAAGGERPIWGEITGELANSLVLAARRRAVHGPALARARRARGACGPGDRSTTRSR